MTDLATAPVATLDDNSIFPVRDGSNAGLKRTTGAAIRAAYGGSGGGGGGSGETQAHVAFSPTSSAMNIAKSYNISSITRTATGRYRVTFNIPFADINYNVWGEGQFSSFADNNWIAIGIDRQGSKTTTYCDITVSERYNGNVGDFGCLLVVSFQQFNATAGTGGGGATAAIALIGSQTLAAAAASVTFSSIPDTYTDLILRINARGVAAATTEDVNLALNADTTAGNYQVQQLQGAGTGASAASNPGSMNRHIGSLMAANATAGETGQIELTFPNYAGTTFRKGYHGINGLGAYPLVKSLGGRWANTAAITSLALTLNSGGNFAIGSDFRLYGRL